jgi:hypothetical protein
LRRRLGSHPAFPPVAANPGHQATHCQCCLVNHSASLPPLPCTCLLVPTPPGCSLLACAVPTSTSCPVFVVLYQHHLAAACLLVLSPNTSRPAQAAPPPHSVVFSIASAYPVMKHQCPLCGERFSTGQHREQCQRWPALGPAPALASGPSAGAGKPLGCAGTGQRWSEPQMCGRLSRLRAMLLVSPGTCHLARDIMLRSTFTAPL